MNLKLTYISHLTEFFTTKKKDLKFTYYFGPFWTKTGGSFKHLEARPKTSLSQRLTTMTKMVTMMKVTWGEGRKPLRKSAL